MQQTTAKKQQEAAIPRPAGEPFELDSTLRERYVAEAAYYKAEQRGFEAGFEEQDWREAEEEIDRQIGLG